MEACAIFDHEFDTARDLFNAFQEVAHEMKFSLKILRSDYKKKRASISCDRAGSYTSVASERKSSTKKTSCEFRLLARQNSNGKWKMDTCSGKHNHELYEVIDMHTSARKLTDQQRTERARLERAGVKPKEQLAFLRQQHTGFSAVQRDLYNDKQKSRRQFLDGRSPLQALFDVVEASHYRFEYQRDDSGHITHLMLSHLRSLTLAREFYDVILLDCTYKTNNYGLPVLVCTGMTPFGKSLLCCTIFMAAEEVNDYVWAFESIKKLFSDVGDPQVIAGDNEKALLRAGQLVFPEVAQLLCRWHINKNVLARSKKIFQVEHE